MLPKRARLTGESGTECILDRAMDVCLKCGYRRGFQGTQSVNIFARSYAPYYRLTRADGVSLRRPC